MHSPLTSHFDIALSLLKYLKVAPGSGIQFSKRNSGFNVVALCDSDWAKCLSKKETMAAATCEVMWIVKIMRDLNVNNMIRADLYCDNKSTIQIRLTLEMEHQPISAIQISTNPLMHEKTKHFDIDVKGLFSGLSAAISVSESTMEKVLISLDHLCALCKLLQTTGKWLYVGIRASTPSNVNEPSHKHSYYHLTFASTTFSSMQQSHDSAAPLSDSNYVRDLVLVDINPVLHGVDVKKTETVFSFLFLKMLTSTDVTTNYLFTAMLGLSLLGFSIMRS
ncbi:ribonuclease H-like domain-containing protein [Tanacetum coccineum]